MAAGDRSTSSDALLIAAVALAVRLIQLNHTPQVDELNHVLAARSLLASGSLAIEGGVPYDRGWLFTYAVAALFRLFGESLVVARMPAVLAGTALVVSLFLWVRAIAGRGAAWAAALLLAASPGAIYVSQLSRFYAPQALLFFLGAVLVYRAATPGSTPRRALVDSLGAAACLSAAMHLQIVTLAGIAALLLWAAVAAGPRAVTWVRGGPPWRWITVALLLATGALVAALALPEAVGRAWALFRYTDLWAEGNRTYWRFYHEVFRDRYPTLWQLLPVAALLACRTNPRAAVFATWVFAFALGLHSLAAWKSERYVAYLMPLFFAVWGMALGIAIPWLRTRLEELLARAPVQGAVGARAPIATILLVGIGIFVAASNAAFPLAYRMLTVDDAHWRSPELLRGEPDWRAAADSLRHVAAGSRVVLSSSDLKPLYYLGRLDVILYAGLLVGPTGRAPEFALSSKVGRPIISSVESLRSVVACHPSGLVLIERAHWRWPAGVAPATADYLVAETTPIPLPDDWKLLAFAWQRGPSSPVPGCDA